MSELRRVLIIHPEGNSFNNPTMKAVIDLLCDRGVFITLMHGRTAASMPEYRGIQYVAWRLYWRKLKSLVLNRFSSPLFSRLVFHLERISQSIENPDLIIGVDREGLIQAGFLSHLLSAPYVFFSFEIMFVKETSRKFKSLECIAAAQVSHWFVQDTMRRDLLIQENGLSSENCSLIPLASKGMGARSITRLRDNLGVPPSMKVAILMGSLSDWSMTDDVLDTVEKWPTNWCVLVHSRYGGTSDYFARYFSNYSDLLGKKIFLSDSAPKKVDDLAYVLTGVDAGLAFYKPNYACAYTGDNLAKLGLASGKISTCLRYGIPIVMNELGMYSELAREFRFGLVIHNVTELPEALVGLEDGTMSPSALDFFQKKLDFVNYEGQVWKGLSSRP